MIIINVKSRDHIPDSCIESLKKIAGVSVNIWDYSIVKPEYSINTIRMPFEDFDSSSDRILSEMPEKHFAAIITPNMTIQSNVTDLINFDFNFGAIYTDYTTKGIHIYLKAPPFQNAHIPFIFWNTSKTKLFDKDKIVLNWLD